MLYVGTSFFALFAFSHGPFSGLPRADAGAAILVACQKTLAIGIPMIQVLYEGNPDVGVVAIPLLLYHPSQLIVSSLMVATGKSWILLDPKNAANTAIQAADKLAREPLAPFATSVMATTMVDTNIGDNSHTVSSSNV